MITAKMSLADIVKQYPQTIPYLNNLHLDYCCGGHMPLDESFTDGSIDLTSLINELNNIASQPVPQNKESVESIEDFEKLSVNEMLDNLEATHHVTEREMMEQIEKLLNKILIVHYLHHGAELAKIHNLFARMKAELEEHFAKEERLIFPLMRSNHHPDKETLELISELEGEHVDVGDMIKEMQQLTNNFQVPADTCVTYANTFKLMKDFVEDIFVHVFKENSITFPEYAEQ